MTTVNASGRRAFQRDTAADSMSAILTADPPDLAGTRPDLAPALDRIVRHCLEKSPHERFQTARDVAFALETFSGTNVGSAAHTTPHIAPARRWLRVAALAVFGLVLVAAGVFIDRALHPPPSPITFDAKTWNSEWITNARFGPDGQTIVFSAAPTGNLPQLFAIRPGSAIAQPFGDPETQLLSVSSTGELAVLTGARLALGDVSGTLAQMTIDGAPRAWMQDVAEADWSPDGTTLALLRIDGGKYRLEYPIGQLLVQSAGGYLSDIRVSPDGSRVAFFDHQIVRDDRGWLRVVDRAGKVETLAGEYRTERGLAWSPDGESIFFSASNEGAWQPLVVNASGTPVVRSVLPSADGMQVLDVAKDGRMLILRAESRQGLRGLLPGETEERDFSWLDMSYMGTLSADGRQLLFGDANVTAGMNYAVALRDIRTGKVARLGEGIPGPISPDGLWAPALVPSTGDMVFYPTGIGEPRKLLRGPIDQYIVAAQLLPDGHTAFFCGSEKGKAPRCYVQEVLSGAPTPVTPEGTSSALLANDGRTLLLRTTAGTYQVGTIGGGPPVQAKGLLSTDTPLAWTTDRRGVFVRQGVAIPAQIDRVDPATGMRTTVKTLAPPDRAGVTGVQPHQWIDDGRGYVYSYQRILTKLFVATGVK